MAMTSELAAPTPSSALLAGLAAIGWEVRRLELDTAANPAPGRTSLPALSLRPLFTINLEDEERAESNHGVRTKGCRSHRSGMTGNCRRLPRVYQPKTSGSAMHHDRARRTT